MFLILIFHLEACDIPVAEVLAQLLHLHVQHDDGGNDEDDHEDDHEDDAKDDDKNDANDDDEDDDSYDANEYDKNDAKSTFSSSSRWIRSTWMARII